MQYNTKFREEMVKKLSRIGGPSVGSLSEEVGVHPSTLSRWVREARGKSGATPGLGSHPTRRAMMERRPQDWTAEEKLTAVVETSSMSEEELGPFLREKGLREAHLQQWREAILAGLEKKRGSSRHTAEARRIRELERELTRKEKALAETAALLVLKKKANFLWGDEDDDTVRKSGRRS